MEREVVQAMKAFLSAQKRLNELGVINSGDYIGDIGRYLCQLAYGLAIPEGGRPAGYDGMVGSSRVAVRMNNCPVGTVVRVNEPLDFDELIVILGPNCSLRPAGVASDFILYRLRPDEVQQRFKATKGGYVGGSDAFDRNYDKALNLTAG